MSIRLIFKKLPLPLMFLCAAVQANGSLLEELNVSGKKGDDAAHGSTGSNGSDGFGSGADGEHGGEGDAAGEAEKGENAGKVLLDLAAGGEKLHGVVVLEGSVTSPQGQKRGIKKQIRFENEGYIYLYADGGEGGKGGVGGTGGRGGDGARGRNANQGSPGGNGGDGGKGGHGGKGSSGANGGKGGEIKVTLAETDTHLLMLIKHSEGGGAGGEKGSHGKGGKGGDGGSGGNSYSWNEPTGQDSSGNTTYTQRISSGGSSGSDGSKGDVYTHKLSDGEKGKDGKYSIDVRNADGTQTTYEERYDLKLLDYTLTPAQNHGIFEPGETVFVKGITIQNTGKMPTPKNVLAEIYLVNGEWVIANPMRLTLPVSLKPGEKYTFSKEELQFKIRDSIILKADERFSIRETISPLSELPVVNRPFEDFANRREFRISTPIVIERADGLRTMAQGEYTRVIWKVTNVSKKSFGTEADVELRRLIRLNMQIADSELDDRHIEFFNSRGEKTDLNNSFIEAITKLGPGESTLIEGKLGLDPKAVIEPNSKLRIETKLEVGNINDGTVAREMERRSYVLRVAELFQVPDSTSRALLVTNHGTEKAEVNAWKETLGRLGIETAVWSLSYYGLLDLVNTIGSNPNMLQSFKGKTIVLFNNVFENDQGKKHLGDDYLSKAQILKALGEYGINVYFPGSSGGTNQGQAVVNSYMIPTDGELNRTDRDEERHRGIEAYLKFHREKFSALREDVWFNNDAVMTETTESQNYTHYYDLIELSRWAIFGKPSGKQVAEAARNLQKKLSQMHPNRRYVVSYDFDPEIIDKKWWRGTHWRYGSLRVQRTLDMSLGNLVALEVRDTDLHKPEFVTSTDNYLGLFMAMGFEQKMKLFKEVTSDYIRLTHGEKPKTLGFAPKGLAEVGQMLLNALLVDIVVEQSALRIHTLNRGMTKATIIAKLKYLTALSDLALSENDLARVIDPEQPFGKMLVRFSAELASLVSDQVSWWEYLIPGSRSRKVTAISRKLIDQIVFNLLPSKMVDPSTGEEVKIARRIRSEMALIHQEMKTILREDGEITRRQASIRRLLDGNINRTDLTSDAELSIDPNSRVFSSNRFADLTKAAAEREKRRFEILQQKETAKETLSVDPSHLEDKNCQRLLTETPLNLPFTAKTPTPVPVVKKVDR